MIGEVRVWVNQMIDVVILSSKVCQEFNCLYTTNTGHISSALDNSHCGRGLANVKETGTVIVRRKWGRKRSILEFHNLLSEGYCKKEETTKKKNNPPAPAAPPTYSERRSDFEFYRILFQHNGETKHCRFSQALCAKCSELCHEQRNSCR